MPIDDLPILEIVLRQLKFYGFSEIILAVNHLANLIIAFFGDGEKYGVHIRYSLEDTPLGTAGPLTLIDDLDETFLVMNGDLLTTIDYGDLLNYHVQNSNDITIGTHQKQVKIDLGVLETDGVDFLDYIEKPIYNYKVSMGIYIMNRNIIDLMTKGEKIDIPNLILKAKQRNLKIQCYFQSMDKIWLDIGRVDDYAEACRIFKENRSEFLP